MNKYYNLLLISLCVIVPIQLMAIPGDPLVPSSRKTILNCGSEAKVERVIKAFSDETHLDAQTSDCWKKFGDLKRNPDNFVKCEPCDDCKTGNCQARLKGEPYYTPYDGAFPEITYNDDGTLIITPKSTKLTWAKRPAGSDYQRLECGFRMWAQVECACLAPEIRDVIMTSPGEHKDNQVEQANLEQ